MAVAGRVGCGHGAGEEGHRVGMHRCTATCRAVPPRCRTLQRCNAARLQRCMAATLHAARGMQHTAPLHRCTAPRCTPARCTAAALRTTCRMLHVARCTAASRHTACCMQHTAAPHGVPPCCRTLHSPCCTTARCTTSPPPHGRVALPRRRGMISKYCGTCLPHPCQSSLDLQSRKLLLPPAHQGDERSCRAGHMAGPCGRFTGPR